MLCVEQLQLHRVAADRAVASSTSAQSVPTHPGSGPGMTTEHARETNHLGGEELLWFVCARGVCYSDFIDHKPAGGDALSLPLSCHPPTACSHTGRPAAQNS